jgi:dUTP pyrophosphatase
MNQTVTDSLRKAKDSVKGLNRRVEAVTGKIEETLGKAGIDTRGIESQAKMVVSLVEEIAKETITTTLARAGKLKDIYLSDTDFDRIPLRVKKLANFVGEEPKYESSLASGFDVRAQLAGETINLAPGQRELIPTGLSFEIPEGFEIQARPRSGLAIKHGISLVNSPGTIDADYRGEVKIILINQGTETFTVSDQDRIAQLVLCPIFQADFEFVSTLSETERGEGGFGSTGH